MSAPVEVLAYGVAEREGGPLIALKFTSEDASAYVAKAGSEYRNQQMPAPTYRTVELVDGADVADLIEDRDALAKALRDILEAGLTGPGHVRLFAAGAAALARVQGGAA